MVLLNEMYLNSLIHEKKTRRPKMLELAFDLKLKPRFRGFVCAYHPAAVAPGSNPTHLPTLCSSFTLIVKKTKINKKMSGLALGP